MALTPAGAELARPTIDAFERLRAVYTDTDLPERRTLTISATPTFATRWLSPRIARFRAENPGLSVRLRAVGARLDFGRDDVDVAIRFGRRPAAGQAAQALMRAEFTPMLSPKALHEMGKPGEPADLLRLGLDGPGGPHWATWLRQAGVDPAGLGTGIGHDLEAQLSAAQTAIAGLGIAMLNPRLFRDELAAGRLVQPFDLVGTDGRAYWLVCPEARAAETGIASLKIRHNNVLGYFVEVTATQAAKMQ
ncbi:MAG: LysR substrate-binding domain-containing protein, partial [Pseudomonadota bacterium]